MLDHARHEADTIVAKAEADTKALISRREKMAKDKIAAAERGAIEELRATAAAAAAAAASTLIAAKHTAKADQKLVDEAIAGI
jgi:F-type H+-transporting ATPase subunit b